MTGTPFACVYDDSTRTLTLSGDLDDAGTAELRARLASLTAGRPSSLVMDLSHVDSLPSAAVGVIAAARADMRSRFRHLALVADRGSVAHRLLPRLGMSVREREGLAGHA